MDGKRPYILCLVAFLLLAGPAYAAGQVKYHVSGTFLYYDHEGRTQPAAGVAARVMDRDPNPRDEDDLLATMTTDSEGKFTAEFTAEEYQDVYILFVADNGKWRVVNSGDKVYMWHTPIVWDASEENAKIDFGGQVIGRNSDRVGTRHNVGAMWIYQAVVRSARFCSKHGISLTGDTDIYTLTWTNVDNLTYSSGLHTYIARNHAYMYDVVIHETGHILMEAHSAIPAGSGGRHRIDRAYSRQLAWAEGWATFYAACVLFDRANADADLPFFAGGASVEHVPANFARGDRNEMRVAAALWDFYDVNEDGGDRVSLTFEEIFEVLARTNGKAIDNFEDFVMLLAKDNDNRVDTIRALHAALAHNSVHYSLSRMLRARGR